MTGEREWQRYERAVSLFHAMPSEVAEARCIREFQAFVRVFAPADVLEVVSILRARFAHQRRAA